MERKIAHLRYHYSAMAFNKKNHFHAEEIFLSDFARTLAHPARIAILRKLAENKDCIVGDLVNELPLAQSTVSQHLKELKKAGLIKGHVFGTKSSYCIDWESLKAFAEAFTEFTEELLENKTEDRMC